MTVYGTSAIWRVPEDNTSSSFPEPTSPYDTPDLILFNDISAGNTVSPDAYIFNNSASMTSSIAINENPGGKVDPAQDCGFESLIVTVVGAVQFPDGGSYDTLQRMKTWLIEAKTLSQYYPFGRFGLRLTKMPQLNLTPRAERGYMLHNLQWVQEGESISKLSFVATLRFNGVVGAKIGDYYIW